MASTLEFDPAPTFGDEFEANAEGSQGGDAGASADAGGDVDGGVSGEVGDAAGQGAHGGTFILKGSMLTMSTERNVMDSLGEAGAAGVLPASKFRLLSEENSALKQNDHGTVFFPGKEIVNEDGSPGIGVSPGNYRGEWLNDRRHGYGVQIYNITDKGTGKLSQLKYEGQWVHGRRQGEGVLWQSHGAVVVGGKVKMRKNYIGQWLADKKHGMGTAMYYGSASASAKGSVPSDDQNDDLIPVMYSGEWVNNRKHGEGLMQYRERVVFPKNGGGNQNKYTANRNTPAGSNRIGHYGKTDPMAGPNGGKPRQASYNGQWCEDKRSGYGHLTKFNGDAYEGYFVEDRREGAGSYFYVATGKVFVGEWAGDGPKSGVYQQANKNPSEPGVLPVCYPQVPPTNLRDLDTTVAAALDTVKERQLLYRCCATPCERLYSTTELATLQAIWDRSPAGGGFGSAGSGLLDIAQLRSVLAAGLQTGVSENELRGLVDSILVHSSTPQAGVTFDVFTKVAAILVGALPVEAGADDL